jgi:hypothetical protein
MLVVPFVLGVMAGGAAALHLLLLPAWVLAYLASYYFLQWLRARRRQRFVRPLLVYGGLLAVVGAVLVLLQPELLLFAVLYLPGVLVNVWYARRHDDRSLVNGLVSVAQASLGVPLANAVGAHPDWPAAWRLFALALLYFAGTVFFVKTMIRERESTGYYRASVGYHAAALVPAGLLSPWLLVPFALYLARAVALPRRRLRPAQVGVVEIVNSVLLVAFATVLL